jgi:hypothetical protein
LKSETQCRKALTELESDLKFWREKFERERDPDKRRIHGNTIIGVESQVEMLTWILKE